MAEPGKQPNIAPVELSEEILQQIEQETLQADQIGNLLNEIRSLASSFSILKDSVSNVFQPFIDAVSQATKSLRAMQGATSQFSKMEPPPGGQKPLPQDVGPLLEQISKMYGQRNMRTGQLIGETTIARELSATEGYDPRDIIRLIHNARKGIYGLSWQDFFQQRLRWFDEVRLDANRVGMLPTEEINKFRNIRDTEDLIQRLSDTIRETSRSVLSRRQPAHGGGALPPQGGGYGDENIPPYAERLPRHDSRYGGGYGWTSMGLASMLQMMNPFSPMNLAQFGMFAFSGQLQPATQVLNAPAAFAGQTYQQIVEGIKDFGSSFSGLPKLSRLFGQIIQTDAFDLYEQMHTSFTVLKNVYSSASKSENIMSQSFELARRTPLEVKDLLTIFSTFSVNPELRGILTQREEMTKLAYGVSGLSFLVPEQGTQGAIFAIREALAGQFRSIQRRFNISPEIIASSAGMSITELKEQPSKFLGALNIFLRQNLGENTFNELQDTFTKQVANIYDALLGGVFRAFRTTTFYPVITNYAKELSNSIVDFLDSPNFSSMFNSFSAKLATNFSKATDVLKTIDFKLDEPDVIKEKVQRSFNYAFTNIFRETEPYIDTIKEITGPIAQNITRAMVSSLSRTINEVFTGSIAIGMKQIFEVGGAAVGGITPKPLKPAVESIFEGIGNIAGEHPFISLFALAGLSKFMFSKLRTVENIISSGQLSMPRGILSPILTMAPILGYEASNVIDIAKQKTRPDMEDIIKPEQLVKEYKTSQKPFLEHVSNIMKRPQLENIKEPEFIETVLPLGLLFYQVSKMRVPENLSWRRTLDWMKSLSSGGVQGLAEGGPLGGVVGGLQSGAKRTLLPMAAAAIAAGGYWALEKATRPEEFVLPKEEYQKISGNQSIAQLVGLGVQSIGLITGQPMLMMGGMALQFGAPIVGNVILSRRIDEYKQKFESQFKEYEKIVGSTMVDFARELFKNPNDILKEAMFDARDTRDMRQVLDKIDILNTNQAAKKTEFFTGMLKTGTDEETVKEIQNKLKGISTIVNEPNQLNRLFEAIKNQDKNIISSLLNIEKSVLDKVKVFGPLGMAITASIMEEFQQKFPSLPRETEERFQTRILQTVPAESPLRRIIKQEPEKMEAASGIFRINEYMRSLSNVQEGMERLFTAGLLKEVPELPLEEARKIASKQVGERFKFETLTKTLEQLKQYSITQENFYKSSVFGFADLEEMIRERSVNEIFQASDQYMKTISQQRKQLLGRYLMSRSPLEAGVYNESYASDIAAQQMQYMTYTAAPQYLPLGYQREVQQLEFKFHESDFNTAKNSYIDFVKTAGNSIAFLTSSFNNLADLMKNRNISELETEQLENIQRTTTGRVIGFATPSGLATGPLEAGETFEKKIEYMQNVAQKRKQLAQYFETPSIRVYGEEYFERAKREVGMTEEESRIAESMTKVQMEDINKLYNDYKRIKVEFNNAVIKNDSKLISKHIKEFEKFINENANVLRSVFPEIGSEIRFIKPTEEFKGFAFEEAERIQKSRQTFDELQGMSVLSRVERGASLGPIMESFTTTQNAQQMMNLQTSAFDYVNQFYNSLNTFTQQFQQSTAMIGQMIGQGPLSEGYQFVGEKIFPVQMTIGGRTIPSPFLESALLEEKEKSRLSSEQMLTMTESRKMLSPFVEEFQKNIKWLYEKPEMQTPAMLQSVVKEMQTLEQAGYAMGGESRFYVTQMLLRQQQETLGGINQVFEQARQGNLTEAMRILEGFPALGGERPGMGGLAGPDMDKTVREFNESIKGVVKELANFRTSLAEVTEFLRQKFGHNYVEGPL